MPNVRLIDANAAEEALARASQCCVGDDPLHSLVRDAYNDAIRRIREVPDADFAQQHNNISAEKIVRTSDERFFFYNDDSGKWEFYDSTYDITIHCKSKQEQDEAVSILRRANLLKHTGVAMEPENMAFALKRFCKGRLDNGEGCADCFFNGPQGCRIEAPNCWNV